MARTFISYAHLPRDRAVARRLYRDLRSAGKHPWLDESDLVPGEPFAVAIEREIRQCRFFIALLSSGSLDRQGYAQSELRQALRVLDTFPTDGRFLIPVLLDPCEPRDARLRELHWCDLYSDYDAGLERLLAALDDPSRNSGRLYIDVGLEVPPDLAKWPHEEFCAYVRGPLMAEARERALRDYESVPIRDFEDAVRIRTRERLLEVASAFGFLQRLKECAANEG